MALNLRYFIRLTAAFVSRFKIILLLGILIGVGVFFLINYILPTFFGKSEDKIALTGKYTLASLPDSVLVLMGEGLTKVGPQGEAEPDLAKSWETPDKGKTWIFHLRDNVFWQDGKKVDSGDINYDFSDLTIERPDKLTVVFKLQSPFSPFPMVVTRPVFRKGLLGTGTWKVTNISLNGDFVYRLDLTDKKGNIKIFKFYPSDDRTKLAFMLGEVNEVDNIFDPEPFNSWKTVNIDVKSDHSKFVAIFFNTQDKFLSEKAVRQALSYAARKDFREERAISPISPFSWAYNPQVKPYNFDEARAKELLDSLPSELKNNKKVVLTTNSLLLPVAEKIAKNWNEAGVDTKVKATAGIPTDFQAFLAIFDIPSDPDQYSLWHSSQISTNISKYQNPRIDKLLEEGRTTVDMSERKKIYLDFQRFLVEDSPALFLYHPLNYTITRK